MVSTFSKAILTGLACGTLGVGIGGVWAFSSTPVEQEPMRTMVRPASAGLPAAESDSTGKQGDGMETRPETEATAPSSMKTHAASTSPAKGSTDQSGGEVMQIKRLVVTDRIEGREPARDPKLRADGSEVFAFVELSNPGEEAQNIEIVFEHESGQQVGFVKLPVPKDKSRWRTWGKTQQIKKSGRWVAKVRSEGGAELMRRDFVVQQS